MKKYRSLYDLSKDDPTIFKLVKTANGRNLCRYCSTEVLPPRRNYCSKECLHEWMIRSNIRYARSCVRKRDKGICNSCKLDCSTLKKYICKLPCSERYIKAQEYEIPRNRLYGSFWDLDHIIPIYKEQQDLLSNIDKVCGLDNLQTLCIKCHKNKSKEEAKERAKYRKLIKKELNAK